MFIFLEMRIPKPHISLAFKSPDNWLNEFSVSDIIPPIKQWIVRVEFQVQTFLEEEHAHRKGREAVHNELERINLSPKN
jgi:hypothetical protein